MKKPSHLKPNCPALLLTALTGLLAAANLANSQTWTPTSAPPQDWQAIAASADGLKLVAAGYQTFFAGEDLVLSFPTPIYISADSGATWKQTPAPSGYWRSVACSADGTKLVAADGGIGLNDGLIFHGLPDPHGYGSIYVSTNSGETWTPTTAPSNSWNSVASSADGTKLIAAAYATYDTNDVLIGTVIYTSADSGLNWTASPLPSNTWSCVASSADGAKLVAAAYAAHDTNGAVIGNLIYTSTNSGATWTPASVVSNSWSSVAYSADGTKLVATSGSEVLYGAIYGLIYTSTNSGVTWTPSSAPSNNWASVASSKDGTILIAAAHETYNPFLFGTIGNLIYRSTNSGTTWMQEVAPSNSWASVACSSDGTRIVAAGDRCYVSSYQGPWKLADAPAERWVSVASSADGTKLAAVSDRSGIDEPGLVWTSADSGATWTETSVPPNFWSVVAVSSNGARIVAVADGRAGPGGSSSPIYTSLDSGATWIRTSAPSNDWSSVASSADGTKLVVASFYDRLVYTSSDSGVTWKPANAPLANYTSIASSANGSKLVAESLSDIYSSADMGVTWALTGAPDLGSIGADPWLSIASSADGSKLVACTAADYNSPDSLIYTSFDSGATWTKTSASSNYWSCVACSADGTVLAACAGNLIGPAIFR